MTGSSPPGGRLTPLQRDLLAAFFARETRFTLTGGAALAGVDSLREIASNKLDALLGRAEIRDLVDLWHILGAGVELDQAMRDAERKDAGADPATLAWVLDQITIAPSARMPGGADPAVVDAFRKDLVRRLRALALDRAMRR
jgi:hypothetical protein